MSTTFDDRKNAFEAKFAHDEQALFRAEARACKMFGLWAAEQMGISGDAAGTYAQDVVISNLDTPGLDDVVDKVDDDMKNKGLSVDRADLAGKLDQFFAQAKDQMTAEGA